MEKDEIPVICPRCNGNKKITMTKYPQGKGRAIVLCPECDGKGWIEAAFIADTGGVVSVFR